MRLFSGQCTDLNSLTSDFRQKAIRVEHGSHSPFLICGQRERWFSGWQRDASSTRSSEKRLRARDALADQHAIGASHGATRTVLTTHGL